MNVIADSIYLSGPIGGHDIEVRTTAFQIAEDYFNAHGWLVVNPLKVKPCDDGACEDGPKISSQDHMEHTYNCYLRHDIAAMLECEAIAMLRGWTKSKGARIENDLALAMDMTMFFESDDWGWMEVR